MEGVLEKKGSHIGGLYHSRFYVLNSETGVLNYYHDEEECDKGSDPRGSLALYGAVIERIAHPASGGKRYGFTISFESSLGVDTTRSRSSSVKDEEREREKELAPGSEISPDPNEMRDSSTLNQGHTKNMNKRRDTYVFYAPSASERDAWVNALLAASRVDPATQQRSAALKDELATGTTEVPVPADMLTAGSTEVPVPANMLAAGSTEVPVSKGMLDDGNKGNDNNEDEKHTDTVGMTNQQESEELGGLQIAPIIVDQFVRTEQQIVAPDEDTKRRDDGTEKRDYDIEKRDDMAMVMIMQPPSLSVATVHSDLEKAEEVYTEHVKEFQGEKNDVESGKKSPSAKYYTPEPVNGESDYDVYVTTNTIETDTFLPKTMIKIGFEERNKGLLERLFCNCRRSPRDEGIEVV